MAISAKRNYIFLFFASALPAALFASALNVSSRTANSTNDEANIPKCAKTPHNKKLNYFEQKDDCSKGFRNWTLVVQAESGTLGKSCIGPSDQSFLINGRESPVSIKWTPNTGSNKNTWSNNIKVDTLDKTSCNNQYTFFGFMDHVDHGGAPLPNLADLRSFHKFSYEQSARSGGEVRMTLGAQVFWGGKAHIIEVLPARIGYKANPGFPAGVLQKITTPEFDYIILDDSWGPRIVPDGSPQIVTVKWSYLFSRMIDLGLFNRPTGETATQAVYTAVETHNRAMGDLHQYQFQVLRK